MERYLLCNSTTPQIKCHSSTVVKPTHQKSFFLFFWKEYVEKHLSRRKRAHRTSVRNEGTHSTPSKERPCMVNSIFFCDLLNSNFMGVELYRWCGHTGINPDFKSNGLFGAFIFPVDKSYLPVVVHH